MCATFNVKIIIKYIRAQIVRDNRLIIEIIKCTISIIYHRNFKIIIIIILINKTLVLQMAGILLSLYKKNKIKIKPDI